jgi:hypothetical protein
MPDFGRVFRNRDVLVLIVGYAAAIWGIAGLRLRRQTPTRSVTC